MRRRQEVVLAELAADALSLDLMALSAGVLS